MEKVKRKIGVWHKTRGVRGKNQLKAQSALKRKFGVVKGSPIKRPRSREKGSP